MKTKILLFVLFSFVILSCSENSSDEEIENEKIISGELIGKWQITEECYYDFNTPRQCKEVENSRIYYFQFKDDGIVETNRNSENCDIGTYSLEENNQIYLLFDCTDYLLTIEEKSSSNLELNSRSDDGGVIYKFNRIN